MTTSPNPMPDRGRRIRLISTTDPYTKLQPGAEGTVFRNRNGIVEVDWDCGSTLSMITAEGDRFEWLT